MSDSMGVFLLSIRGVMATPELEASRVTHNKHAGTPENIAAARALGDLSHMVYTPIDGGGAAANEILFLDHWNSLEGLNAFFAHPQVQEGGALIFAHRDPGVWMPAEGFAGYHFPAPADQTGRYIGIVRGPVASREQAREIHNALVGPTMSMARAAGSMSHEAYFRLAPPGSPEALEFFAVDVWHNGQGMAQFYQNPQFLAGFQKLFAGMPSATAWMQPAGQWTEW